MIKGEKSQNETESQFKNSVKIVLTPVDLIKVVISRKAKKPKQLVRLSCRLGETTTGPHEGNDGLQPGHYRVLRGYRPVRSTGCEEGHEGSSGAQKGRAQQRTTEEEVGIAERG